MSDLDQLAEAAQYAPVQEQPLSQPMTIRQPSYGAITRGAAVLRILALLQYLVGWALIALGIVAGTAGMAMPMRMDVSYSGLLVLGGMLSLATGALLSMTAAIGVAIRDMAINSFRPR